MAMHGACGMRHALAFHLQTEFCPHTPNCGDSGEPNPYYTTVDVLVVDGEPDILARARLPVALAHRVHGRAVREVLDCKVLPEALLGAGRELATMPPPNLG